MTAHVIQGFFPGGRPRLSAPAAQPKAPQHVMPRLPGPPMLAFAGYKSPANTHPVQAYGTSESFQVDPGKLGLASGGGKPLSDAVRGKMEAALGADFSDVRVHVGPQAERIGAVAFTMGSEIYFAPGRYQPDTLQGQQLLGHELAHVVQQRQGRVRNPMGTGVAVVQDQILEAEADRMGLRASAQPVNVQAKPAACRSQSRATSVVHLPPSYGGHTELNAVQAKYGAPVLRAASRVAAPATIGAPSSKHTPQIVQARMGVTGSGVIQLRGCQVCGHKHGAATCKVMSRSGTYAENAAASHILRNLTLEASSTLGQENVRG